MQNLKIHITFVLHIFKKNLRYDLIIFKTLTHFHL